MQLLVFIDSFLNKITMYRLVFYVLVVFLAFAEVFSYFKYLPFTPLQLLISTSVILITCWLSNKIFAKIFNAVTNLESTYITAFILALIITPVVNIKDFQFLIIASILAMGSKYILALNRRHIFNPAAASVFITSMVIGGYASWWVGTQIMFPIVLLGGLLITRKIQRFSMVVTFWSVSLIAIASFYLLNGAEILTPLYKSVVESPILFFSVIMLTEPLTTPPGKKLQMVYATIVGMLFYPQVSYGQYFTTPEFSLLMGNIFSFIVSPKLKVVIKLKEKLKIAPDVYDFIFANNKKFSFLPGQYLEWTLNIKNPDSRGNRRYFTIASSPTEENLRIGVKFYPSPSSFKSKLSSLGENDRVLTGSLAGDFILPKDINKKIVFIAGGIGITPFRSMLKYLLDSREKRDIVLFYANKNKEDIVYKEIFDQAEKQLGIKTVYVLSDIDNIPKDWKGEKGRLTEVIIRKYVGDYKDREFYISGPHTMTTAFEDVLSKMGISKSKIRTDFFPGYA